MKDKRIIELDINALIASAQGLRNIEELVIKAMTELSNAGNTIATLMKYNKLYLRKLLVVVKVLLV